MLISGWILPDLYEVKCKSRSTLNEHIEVVKRYLNNLKTKDISIYNKIMQTLDKAKKTHPYLELDDFAVMYLGWIKVNNYPMNIIFYVQQHKLEYIIQKHINFGYVPVVLEKPGSVFTTDIPSHELI